MRARPRTWPSIRRKRLSTEAFAEVLANLCIAVYIPHRGMRFKAFMIVQQSAQSSGEIDPVCGMKVDPATSTYRHMHGERLYHFCSTGCLKKFMNQPEKFLSRRDRSPQTSHAGATYTCPMHPQIRQMQPGSCPICGMALELVTSAEDTGPSPE